MPDYKAMYYHLAGRMATAVDALEATTKALVEITEKLKLAQQTTEEMFVSASDDDADSPRRNALHSLVNAFRRRLFCGLQRVRLPLLKSQKIIFIRLSQRQAAAYKPRTEHSARFLLEHPQFMPFCARWLRFAGTKRKR